MFYHKIKSSWGGGHKNHNFLSSYPTNSTYQIWQILIKQFFRLTDDGGRPPISKDNMSYTVSPYHVSRIRLTQFNYSYTYTALSIDITQRFTHNLFHEIYFYFLFRHFVYVKQVIKTRSTFIIVMFFNPQLFAEVNEYFCCNPPPPPFLEVVKNYLILLYIIRSSSSTQLGLYA